MILSKVEMHIFEYDVQHVRTNEIKAIGMIANHNNDIE